MTDFHPEMHHRVLNCPMKIAAAALRALAVRIKGADNIRQDVLDIADELDGATTTRENDL
jgi:hypothetical protein